MNIEELSIGDWVKWNGKPRKIEQIGYEGEMFVRVGVCYCCSIEECSPIPLTPEILEKNGFTQLEPSVNYDWWCLDNKDNFLVGFGFGKEKGHTATGWVFDTVGSCDYKRQIGVHELQNLLRLAGVEKEIELC